MAVLASVDNDGTKRWRNKEGILHRIGGPAVIYKDGTELWFKNDRLHRLDGPAVTEYGEERWYVDGQKISGPLELLGYGTNWRDLAEWLTPREIALCRAQK